MANHMSRTLEVAVKDKDKDKHVTHVMTMRTLIHIQASKPATLLLLLCLRPSKAVLLHKLAAPIPMLRTAAIKITLPCGMLPWPPRVKVVSRLKVSSVDDLDS